MATRRKNRLFIVEDDELLSLVLLQGFRKEGYDVEADPGIGDIPGRLEKEKPDVLLLDVSLPGVSGLDILKELKSRGNDFPVIMLTADDTAETAVNALKLGAYDYITKPFEIEKLKIIVRNAFESLQLKRTIEQFRDDTVSNTLMGKSPVMRSLIEDIKKLAEQRVQNLLVLGESGTGKELVSRAIHNASPAYASAFVAINCAALPHGLLESELFGHEKGSFTDAKGTKKGLFEEADGGTLVLDEIGDMDISLQAKLLRVLENRTIRRIGGTKEIPFNVMVIATTNRDLGKLQKEGKFRQDLFYRLNMFTLRIPPLRERKEDIPLLAEHFFATSKKEFGREDMQMAPEVMEVLLTHSWPGNVRELKSLFAKICLLEKSDVVRPEHVLQRMEVVPEERLQVSSVPDSGLCLYDVEKKLIQETLHKAKGNMKKAARLLNISYDTLRYRMKKFQIR